MYTIKNRIASLCLMQDTACLGLVHGDDPERCCGEGGGRGIQDWELVYTHVADSCQHLGSKITADGDCSHEIKRCLLLGRKTMINLDTILKSRHITLPTKVHLVKAMVFLVVMYGCESWTV